MKHENKVSQSNNNNDIVALSRAPSKTYILDEKGALQWSYDSIERMIEKHINKFYKPNKNLSDSDLDDMKQEVLVKIYHIDLNKFDQNKGNADAYLKLCIEHNSKKAFMSLFDSMGEKYDKRKKRMNINTDYFVNKMSIEDIMLKYNIKKEKTVLNYLNWDGRIDSMDAVNDDGQSLYNKIAVEDSRVESLAPLVDKNLNEHVLQIKNNEFAQIIKTLSKKEAYIISVYLQEILDTKTIKGSQKRTIEICRSKYNLTKKEIIDTIHLFKEKIENKK